MRFEKYAIFCIFILVLIVAAFNMIGSLSMLVLEKQKDIQVLQAMGADKNWIRKVFLSEGILLAFIGAAAGMIMAALLCYIQIKFMLVPLEGASFIINYYPVKMVASDFLVVCITVFIIAMVALWYPAKRAAEQTFELRN
jgi:lipoprotein-releasing system permease protein